MDFFKEIAVEMSKLWRCRPSTKYRLALYCALLGLISSASASPAKTEEKTIQSVRQFVQGFYNWYVPKALSGNPGLPWGAALAARESNFSPEIASLLRKELQEQGQATGEISGIDFDPFLNTQDPDDQYKVGNKCVAV